MYHSAWYACAHFMFTLLYYTKTTWHSRHALMYHIYWVVEWVEFISSKLTSLDYWLIELGTEVATESYVHHMWLDLQEGVFHAHKYRFYHHTIDTLSDNPCVHVLWPTVHRFAFPEAAFWDMSDVHECLVYLYSVVFAGCSTKATRLWGLTWPLIFFKFLLPIWRSYSLLMLKPSVLLVMYS